MTLEQELKRIHTILGQIRYKPNTGFRVKPYAPDGMLIQAVAQVVDSNDPNAQPSMVGGPRCFIHLGESEDKILMEIFQMFIWWEQHEVAEHFTYKGEKIYDPHMARRNR